MRFFSKKVDDPIYGHFDSETEFKYYKYLLKLQEDGEIKDLKKQVEHMLIPSFKDSLGNTVRSCTYTSDFEYINVATNNLIITDCKGSKFCIDEKFKVKYKMLKYLQKDIPNIQYSIVMEEEGRWFDIEDKNDKKQYNLIQKEKNAKKKERKAKRELNKTKSKKN